MTEVVGVVTGITTELFEINQVSLAHVPPKISYVEIKLQPYVILMWGI